MPAAQPAQRPQNIGTPADAPVQNPAQTPSGVPPQPYPGQTGQGNTQDPLETPIKIQPAQPGQPVPIDIAPPVPVTSLPSIAVDYPVTVTVAHDHLGSTYITDDDVIYPMALRLYSLGYLDTAFISLRPWTRRSLLHALEQSAPAIQSDGDEQAMEIYTRLIGLLSVEVPGSQGTLTSAMTRGKVFGVESAYTRLMGISGLTLRDSYHLGQTIVNDYGRPYEPGFNNLTGFSSVNEWGRFSLYVRGEYEHSPSATGYSPALATELSAIDGIPYPGTNNYQLNQATIPSPVINTQDYFRLQEATLSFHLLGHEVSGGKSDAWIGPGLGGGMEWSNNAEDIYSFRINRVEPLTIPYFAKVLGPLRYDFFVGSLKGHSYPNDPWVHSEAISLSPSVNFQFGVQRTAIWGGHGHGCLLPDGTVYPCNEPITLHTFLKSFFSFNDTTGAEKYSRDDPGARFSSFFFSYRLPFIRKYATLYTDSTTHDDVNPISAPRRAGWRPGIYLTKLPGLPRLDLRVEGVYTDYPTLRSIGGQGNYLETIQRQGYTNKGFIMGDWIGREGKGGQAWLTYHLSADQWIQLEYLTKKTAKDFVPNGTTQNQFKVDVVKRLRPELELDASYQFEKWKAPVYVTGAQNDSVFNFQVKFYPKLHTHPEVQAGLNGRAVDVQPSDGPR